MDPETRREVAVSVAAVVFFVIVVVVIGATFVTDGGLSPRGGIYMTGAVTGFVLVMAGVGYFLAIR